MCGLLSRTNSSLIICIFLCSTTVAYEPIIRKLSNHLLSLELTTKLLSQQSTNPVQLERLSKLLETARVEINAKKKCMLEGEFCLMSSNTPILSFLPFQQMAAPSSR